MSAKRGGERLAERSRDETRRAGRSPRPRRDELRPVRDLVVVLGDQLDPEISSLDRFDPRQDRIWMAEAAEESTQVWSHKARIALFLSAMRHHRDLLRARDLPLEYTSLEEEKGTLASALSDSIRRWKPARLVVAEPGEWRVLESLRKTARSASIPLEIRPDRRFLCNREEFQEHARGRKQLRMEFFYREMRRRTGRLMEQGRPAGGRWNFDAENRRGFGPAGPGLLPEPLSFQPDVTTRSVLRLVEERFPDHPGSLDFFDWPVTRDQALQALEDFTANRLRSFGPWQDAMWSGQPYLHHSRLSAALNLGLLRPSEVLDAVEAAWRDGRRRLPLASVEGFVRQILGWREFVRGVYWQEMPDYLERNALGADRPLPEFYWTGETGMRCLAEAVGQTLRLGYAHHIQRLMVTGLFALLCGVDPKQVHAWYLAVYVDAVEWVELPNTLGMSQFADGGLLASKPYAATGKYIQRMSDYCGGCRYRPDRALGEEACPFTTLYWDFLRRNKKILQKIPRMGLQLRNLERWSTADLKAVSRQAGEIRG